MCVCVCVFVTGAKAAAEVVELAKSILTSLQVTSGRVCQFIILIN